MNSIGNKQYYANLLYEESFINFLNQVIYTEKDPTLLKVAKEILFVTKGNKIITYRPYYDGFYKKYKFRLRNTKTTEGFKISIHMLDGQNQRFLGKMSSVNKPLPLPPSLNTPEVVKIIDGTDTTLKTDLKVISPINNVSVNPKSKPKTKSKIDPNLPDPFVGPITGIWPIVTRPVMDNIKSTAKKLGDFIDWYPRTSKVDYTFKGRGLYRSNLNDFFDTIYYFKYYRVVWIKPYTITVFDGYAGAQQLTDIKEEWDAFFQSNPSQNMSQYWNWSNPGTSGIYKEINAGGRWWPTSYDNSDGTILKQIDSPNSEELVAPEPCDKTIIEFEENGPRGRFRPLNVVPNSFADLLRYLGVNPPNELNPDYPLLSQNRIIYDYNKVPEWAMPNWQLNNDCARAVDYYEYKLEDNYKLVDTISIVNTNMTILEVKDLPGLERFEVSDCSELVSINLSGANNIKYVAIRNCPKLISITGLGGKRYLEECTVSLTKITSIDVGYCENLNYLYLRNNSLTRINLNGCNNLSLLDVSQNELTSLDISNCTNLFNLYALQNFLTQLDISNNNLLNGVDLSFNHLTSIAVDNILQKTVEFTDSKIKDWDTGILYLHGGFNARPTSGDLISTAGGMEYYIDLVDPDYISSQTEYDNGASRLTDELTGYIQELYDDKVNYAKLKKDVISSPYYDPVYAALTSINGPMKTWRRTDENGEIVPLYKKWNVTINRIDVPLIIFRSYEQ